MNKSKRLTWKELVEASTETTETTETTENFNRGSI